MKGLAPLFLGIFGTFVFSWVGLTLIPNWQIGHLNPQSDEEGTDIYPQPQSGMVERGARVYAANGSRYASAKGTGSPNAEGASRFAVPVSNRKCRSGCVTKPDRGSDVAHGNDWRADVFRRLASCASLFAAQHQHRFKHAFLSFSL